MLNEDKIKLMNEIATFEKKEGKEVLSVNSYFKSDYVAKHMIQGFFMYSLCYACVLLIAILYSIDTIVNTVNIFDVVAIFRNYAVFYVLGLIAYEVITWYVYGLRYEYARRGLKLYTAKLKRLEKRYDFQNRTKELAKEGGQNA